MTIELLKILALIVIGPVIVASAYAHIRYSQRKQRLETLDAIARNARQKEIAEREQAAHNASVEILNMTQTVNDRPAFAELFQFKSDIE